MNTPLYFISCDWGTSNFRLRLVDRHSLRILAERRTDQGVKIIYDRFRRQKQKNRQTFFTHYLTDQIRSLSPTLQPCPVVVTGMASSNIGLSELEYASMPFDDSGRGLNWRSIRLPGDFMALLISGIRSEEGMMRGEETQALGLAAQLASYTNAILLLPGTHSKHLWYRQGQFCQLKNFMTGELFALLSQQSLLSVSVKSSSWHQRHTTAFDAGLSRGLSGSCTANLFSIRARHILHGQTPTDNFFFLSGLLIGDELAYLQQREETVVLAAPAALFPLYRIALEMILPQSRLVLLEEPDLELGLLRGQQKILEHYEEREYFSLETL